MNYLSKRNNQIDPTYVVELLRSHLFKQIAHFYELYVDAVHCSNPPRTRHDHIARNSCNFVKFSYEQKEKALSCLYTTNPNKVYCWISNNFSTPSLNLSFVFLRRGISSSKNSRNSARRIQQVYKPEIPKTVRTFELICPVAYAVRRARSFWVMHELCGHSDQCQLVEIEDNSCISLDLPCSCIPDRPLASVSVLYIFLR